MRTIKELIELAQAGEAAEFTTSIQEVLTETALDAVVRMADEPEEDEELDITTEDDIEDLPEDDEIDTEDDQLDERNALNHQKARAFRAGKKEVQAKGMHVSDMRYVGHRYDSRETKQNIINDQKKKKELAGAKAKSMHADATEKGIKLGGRSREFTRIRDAGKAYKTVHGVSDKSPRGGVYDNASHKKFNAGQGKYLHKHLAKQHNVLSREVSDMHDKIYRAIQSDDLRGRNDEKYGTQFKFKEDGKPGLEPHHLENLKKLHGKLKAMHHAISSMAEEVLDWDALAEDFLDVETEYEELLQELDESKTYRANDDDDDDYRGQRRQSYIRRRDRRNKAKMEEVEDEELLSLRDDLSDEELQEILDTISEEHFEMLNDDSKVMLIQFAEKAE